MNRPPAGRKRTKLQAAVATAAEIVAELESLADPANVAGMARYGIRVENALGISAPRLRATAKRIGRDHALARDLWASGIHEARILAGFVDDPARVTPAQLERWAKDFDSWDVCDGVCSNLFDRTPFAWDNAVAWSARPEEYVKRAGFVLMAALAVHDKKAPDERFRRFLPLIEREADGRAQLREEGGQLGAPPDRQTKSRAEPRRDRRGEADTPDRFKIGPMDRRRRAARARKRRGAETAERAMKALAPREIEEFRETILAHYRAHGRRDLPWRKTKDPYRILVSELMLQQTQVARVAGKYGPFIERFPDFASLARAPLGEVVRAWSGLGYNRRALHLREAARAVVSRFDGRLPRRIEDLRALPGVGPATAAEILNFAFNEPRAFIETNVRAVYIHRFFPGRKKVADAEILPLVELTLDARNPRRWFYALMDYGVMLKKVGENPSRRSAHHTRQARFEGSDRQARGRVVKALAKRRMSETELAKATGLSVARIRSIVPGLARDGLVVRRGAKLVIA